MSWQLNMGMTKTSNLNFTLRPANGNGDLEMSKHRLLIEMHRIDSGQLKAFADVTFPSLLGEVTIRSFRVVQEEGKPPWIGFPMSSFEKHGRQINKNILEISKVLKSQVVEAILTEFNRQSLIELPDRPQRDCRLEGGIRQREPSPVERGTPPTLPEPQKKDPSRV